MADYSQELNELIQLYHDNEVDKALEKARVLLDRYPDNEKINRICYLIFCDYGEKLQNSHLFDKGVELIERFKNISNRKSQLESDYSLAHYAKTKLLTPGTQKDEILKIRSEQKQALQNSLLFTQKLNPKTLSILKSDYAVSLGWSGRYVESLDYFYDSLELNPDNAIVISKLGISLLPLIFITPKYNNIILFECWRLLKKATNNHDRLMITKEKVYSDSESLLIVERLIALSFKRGLEELKELIKETEARQDKDFQPSPYLKFIRDKRLLLTVNPKIFKYKDQYKDDLCFEKLMIFNNHHKKFNQLAHIFNQIKEDFATARHLYYQSLSQDKELIEISQITDYVDTLDHADFGLRNGFLKTSLRLAVDLLDKCAGFLNLYLELGNDKSQVDWNNVWYKNLKYSKDKYHSIIGEKLKTNFYLKALLDLKKDLYISKDFYPYKELRNNATHQALILHKNGFSDESKVNYGLEQMQEETYFLLRMIKAAVIYLVGVVMIEEKELEKNTENFPTNNFSTRPGLSDRTID